MRARAPALALVLLLAASPAGGSEPPLNGDANGGGGSEQHTPLPEPAPFDPPHAPEAVFPLLNDLVHDEPERRIAAAMALRELGHLAFPAVPTLETLLDDPVMGVRKAAAGALGGIGPLAAPAVPALARRLEDPHRFVRSWAAMALAEIGPGARGAAPALARMLAADTENLRGRSWCAEALPRVGAPAALAAPALVRAARSDASHEVRSVAILSLQKLGPAAAAHDALPALVDALGHPHPNVRGNAACALPQLLAGPDDPAAASLVSPLAALLGDEAPYVRGCALQGLGDLGPHAARVRPEIERLLDDPHAHVRHRARQALR